MNTKNTTQKGLLAKFTRGGRHFGFTLIELLATLTIMAVIAAILFPFISNYTKKANKDTAIRSLRLMQDAMDRYRSVNENFSGWAAGAAPNYLTYYLLSDANAQLIINDITTAGSNQTLRLPSEGLTNLNVNIVGPSAATNDGAAWEVLWYRKMTNMGGVNRKGQDIASNTFDTGPDAAAISNAFVN